MPGTRKLISSLICIAVIAFLAALTSVADAQTKSFSENQVAIGSNPATNSRHVERVVTHSRQVVVTRQYVGHAVTRSRSACGCHRCKCGK